jgi:hypothetical protein
MEEKGSMLTGGSSQVASNFDYLKADFDALREATAILRDTFARSGLTAARARQTATRARAESQRLRGELFRVRLPHERTPGIAEVPHGLDIVKMLSLGWGAHEGRTHVWAELRVRTPVPA